MAKDDLKISGLNGISFRPEIFKYPFATAEEAFQPQRLRLPCDKYIGNL